MRSVGRRDDLNLAGTVWPLPCAEMDELVDQMITTYRAAYRSMIADESAKSQTRLAELRRPPRRSVRR